MDWFSVDKEGLAKLLDKRGKKFAVAELLANAWDQNVTDVNVNLVPLAGARAHYVLSVEDDDPEGFANLAHAYTLFAESTKKDKAETRGRFNLGEKLVLAVCEKAEIRSTQGSVLFDSKGRHAGRRKTEKGSIFVGDIRMTKAEYEETCAFVRTLIPPRTIRTLFNGEQLQYRQPKKEFELALETELADAEGYLRKTTRKTTVRVFEPLADEVPSLYEMGIPVVETYDKWHIDVQQKVPLNMDRDNVPPAYLRKLRAEVLNQLYAEVKGPEATESWVRQATSSPEAEPEAVDHVLTEMYGEKRVIYDPTDQEANKLAVSQGYNVIYGNSLSKGEWAHVKEHRLALPAGQVTPSPRVQISTTLGNTPENKFVSPDKYTAGMTNIVTYSQELAHQLLMGRISVRIINDIGQHFFACYGGRELIFNVGKLGYRWFEQEVTNPAVNALIIHEFGHHFSSDHLSEKYHDALCDLGAMLARLAIDNPQFFRQFTLQGV